MLSKLLRYWKSQSAANRKAKEDIAAVRSLPLQEARQRALKLISDTRRFRIVLDALSSNHGIERLGPLTKDFFRRFESVVEINGDFRVSRQYIGESSIRQGFVKIGSDFEDSELVVEPGVDRVFIVTDAEHKLDGMPTIYHNICLLE
jgi:hypothetical protein